jgi:hypothetical protein
MSTKSNIHTGTWTDAEMETLQQLISQNTPTRLIAWKMNRTEGSIRKKANRSGMSLKPSNKSPYG